MALRNRVDNLETLLDLVPVGILFIEDGDGAGPIQINRYGARLLGEPADSEALRLAAAPLRLFSDSVELAAEEQPLMRAARSGKAVPSFECSLQRPDGTRIEVLLSATPLFDEAGKTRGAIAAIADITERKKGEAHQQLLLHELQHRVKNTLASVIALAGRMLKGSESAEDFAAALRSRLMAMGRMHELLAERNWEGADLEEMIRATLSLYVDDDRRNFALNGPRVMLKPNAAAAFGMVLHELATNSAKYGPLSTSDGRVNVVWVVAGAPGEERLSVTWEEQDGPPVEPPSAQGFGIGFIQRSVKYELRGTAQMDFRPEGLRVAISIPFEHNVERGAPPDRGRPGPDRPAT